MGYSVFASSASNHSIFVWSRGVFTLMAAWHEVEAAILARSESMEIAWLSRAMPSRISPRRRSAWD